MTKFEQPSFSSPPNNKKYRDNWDRIFGKKSCADDAAEVESKNDEKRESDQDAGESERSESEDSGDVAKED